MTVSLGTQNEEIEKLRLELARRNRELTSKEMFLAKKNRILEEINDSLAQISKEANQGTRLKLNRICRKIMQLTKGEEEWEGFRIQFERTNPLFFQKLKEIAPTLTAKELRHCSYIRMNLQNKEIAQLQNVSYKSIEMSNYRLKKKIGLSADQRLSDFIHSI